MAETSEQIAVGLMGSGEFLPWAEPFDRLLIDSARERSDRVIVLPTASAPEGDEVFDRWGKMGLEHYERMGLEPEVLPLKTREDAHREDLVERLAGSALIFFSGGNPKHLVEVLDDTPFWREVLEVVAAGTALAGCSAGAAFLGKRAPDSSREEMGPDVWGPGLQFFPEVEFAPHWDALDDYQPGLRAQVRDALLPGTLHVFVDEETGAVGDGDQFTVVGRGLVTLERGGYERGYGAGESFRMSEAGASA